MSKHAASRPARRRSGHRSGKVRALLSLGLLLGIAAPGTLAYWSDSATMQGGNFSSGTLNMQLSGNEANPDNWTNIALALGDMVPGESVAAAFTVDNTGTVTFNYQATGTATGPLAPHLTIQAFVGGTGDPTNSAGAGNLRTGTCPGTSTGSAQSLSASPLVFPAVRPLAASTSESVCFVVKLAIDTPDALQGTTGTVVEIPFTANQLGA